MMASLGRNSVRFKDTPVVVRTDEDFSMSSGDSVLIRALQLDETSSSVQSMQSYASDNPADRVQWVGRTPHAKVLEATKSRKVLNDLMKMPELATSMLATPFLDVTTALAAQNTPSDVSMSPYMDEMPHYSKIGDTPFMGAQKELDDTLFLQSEAPSTPGRRRSTHNMMHISSGSSNNNSASSTPSSMSYSFDLLSSEAERVLSAMPEAASLPSPVLDPSPSPLSSAAQVRPRRIMESTPHSIAAMSDFDEESVTSLPKPLRTRMSHTTRPLRAVNPNVTFERPRKVDSSNHKPGMKFSNVADSLLKKKQTTFAVSTPAPLSASLSAPFSAAHDKENDSMIHPPSTVQGTEKMNITVIPSQQQQQQQQQSCNTSTASVSYRESDSELLVFETVTRRNVTMLDETSLSLNVSASSTASAKTASSLSLSSPPSPAHTHSCGDVTQELPLVEASKSPSSVRNSPSQQQQHALNTSVRVENTASSPAASSMPSPVVAMMPASPAMMQSASTSEPLPRPRESSTTAANMLFDLPETRNRPPEFLPQTVDPARAGYVTVQSVEYTPKERQSSPQRPLNPLAAATMMSQSVSSYLSPEKAQRDGVSLGRGPIFACLRAKRVEHNSAMVSEQQRKEKDKERKTPAGILDGVSPAAPLDNPLCAQHATQSQPAAMISAAAQGMNKPPLPPAMMPHAAAVVPQTHTFTHAPMPHNHVRATDSHQAQCTHTLHLAKAWATPRNTRKTAPSQWKPPSSLETHTETQHAHEQSQNTAQEQVITPPVMSAQRESPSVSVSPAQSLSHSPSPSVSVWPSEASMHANTHSPAIASTAVGTEMIVTYSSSPAPSLSAPMSMPSPAPTPVSVPVPVSASASASPAVPMSMHTQSAVPSPAVSVHSLSAVSVPAVHHQEASCQVESAFLPRYPAKTSVATQSSARKEEKVDCAVQSSFSFALSSSAPYELRREQQSESAGRGQREKVQQREQQEQSALEESGYCLEDLLPSYLSQTENHSRIIASYASTPARSPPHNTETNVRTNTNTHTYTHSSRRVGFDPQICQSSAPRSVTPSGSMAMAMRRAPSSTPLSTSLIANRSMSTLGSASRVMVSERERHMQEQWFDEEVERERMQQQQTTKQRKPATPMPWNYIAKQYEENEEELVVERQQQQQQQQQTKQRKPATPMPWNYISQQYEENDEQQQQQQLQTKKNPATPMPWNYISQQYQENNEEEFVRQEQQSKQRKPATPMPWNYIAQQYETNEEEPVAQTRSRSHSYSHSPAHSHGAESETESPQRDLTVLTDVAVASFTQTMLLENEHTLLHALSHANQGERESARDEAQSLCDTTFTLDQSLSDDRSVSSRLSQTSAQPAIPALAIKSLKREQDSPLDVKEINFDTAPGEFTTVMLSFHNHRPRELVLSTDAVLLRIEPAYCSRGRSFTQSNEEPAEQEQPAMEHFTVSPKHLAIPPRGQGVLFVTFSPAADKEGIYSGAMRIKCGKKSYTMLLRGEANIDFSVATPKVVEEARTLSPIQPARKEENTAAPVEQRRHENIPTTPATVFNKKLKALQEKIADVSKKVLWGEETPNKPVSAQKAQQSIVKASSSKSCEDLLLFPSSLSFSVSETVSELTLANHSGRPKIVRLSSSLEEIALSTTFAIVMPNSQYKVNVHIEKLTKNILSSLKINASKLSKHEIYPFGEIDCQCDGKAYTIPVSVGGALLKPLLSLSEKKSSPSSSAVLPITAQEMTNSEMGSVCETHSVLSSTLETISTSVQQERRTSSSSLFDVLATNNASSLAASVAAAAQREPALGIAESAALDDELESIVQCQTQSQSHTMTQTQTQQQQGDAMSQFAESTASHGGLIPHKQGLFFRKTQAQFGSVGIGNLVRTKIELCNATNREVTVFLGDLQLPFVVLHNEVAMRPRSYVRLPVRFIPTVPGEFQTQLVAQTSDGSQITSIQLQGFAYV